MPDDACSENTFLRQYKRKAALGTPAMSPLFDRRFAQTRSCEELEQNKANENTVRPLIRVALQDMIARRCDQEGNGKRRTMWTAIN